jgi:membrane fusion protein (multidrug efflux system)
MLSSSIRRGATYMGAFKQRIEIGNSYNGVAEILKGLAAGDKVISVGYQELIDGEYVRF